MNEIKVETHYGIVSVIAEKTSGFKRFITSRTGKVMVNVRYPSLEMVLVLKNFRKGLAKYSIVW